MLGGWDAGAYVLTPTPSPLLTPHSLASSTACPRRLSFAAGALSEEAATPALNACLDGLYAALAELPPVVGTVTVRLEVAGRGGARH